MPWVRSNSSWRSRKLLVFLKPTMRSCVLVFILDCTCKINCAVSPESVTSKVGIRARSRTDLAAGVQLRDRFTPPHLWTAIQDARMQLVYFSVVIHYRQLCQQSNFLNNTKKNIPKYLWTTIKLDLDHEGRRKQLKASSQDKLARALQVSANVSKTKED